MDIEKGIFIGNIMKYRKLEFKPTRLVTINYHKWYLNQPSSVIKCGWREIHEENKEKPRNRWESHRSKWQTFQRATFHNSPVKYVIYIYIIYIYNIIYHMYTYYIILYGISEKLTFLLWQTTFFFTWVHCRWMLRDASRAAVVRKKGSVGMCRISRTTAASWSGAGVTSGVLRELNSRCSWYMLVWYSMVQPWIWRSRQV